MMMIKEAAPGESAPPLMVTEEMIDERDWSRGQAPFYRVDEVAKFFFGMSASWLRLKLRADEEHPLTWFVLRGQKMDFRRNDPDKDDSSRVFTLADIAPMAWSLRYFGAITPLRLAHVLRIVEAEAYLYDLLKPPPPEDPGDGGEE
jgi:hypothetical protein